MIFIWSHLRAVYRQHREACLLFVQNTETPAGGRADLQKVWDCWFLIPLNYSHTQDCYPAAAGGQAPCFFFKNLGHQPDRVVHFLIHDHFWPQGIRASWARNPHPPNI